MTVNLWLLKMSSKEIIPLVRKEQAIMKFGIRFWIRWPRKANQSAVLSKTAQIKCEIFNGQLISDSEDPCVYRIKLAYI